MGNRTSGRAESYQSFAKLFMCCQGIHAHYVAKVYETLYTYVFISNSIDKESCEKEAQHGGNKH